MFRRKYHFFNITYADKNGKPCGIAVRLRTPYVNDKSLHYGRITLDLPTDAPVIAVSYLGRMTLKQWNSPA